MNVGTSVVLTGVIVTAGQWAEDKSMKMKTFVGLGVLALSLAALSEADTKLAETFGALILVTALLYYARPIAKGLGYTK